MSRSDRFSEIRSIADAISDGSATQEDYQKLEALLNSSDEAMTFYRDYMGLDGQMKAEHLPDLEVVMRRLQVDEMIIRPKGENALLGRELFDVGEKKSVPIDIAKTPTLQKKLPFLLFLSLLLVVFVFWINQRSGDSHAQLLEGKLKSESHGVIESGSLTHTEYEVMEKALIKSKTGIEYILDAHSIVYFEPSSDIFLKNGVLRSKKQVESHFEIATSKFEISGKTSEMQLDIKENNNPILKTGVEALVLQPKRWKPKHYWTFDHDSDRSLDLMGGADGVVVPEVEYVDGLMGKGAYRFTNSRSQIIDVGSGGGTALATGSFAVNDGVSIEALIHSTWNGKDYDEIFRKDRDGELRMILSFQNDWKKSMRKTSFPKVGPGPVLSFGLFLVGEGYHELELLFDGVDQRLSLQELLAEPHHIVASYDCKSGVKAIFIDGVMLASHQYKPGTRVLSGGPGAASLGNSPVNPNEAFSGVLDEVAFYDFALPPLTVKLHYDALQNGLNYFNMEPSAFKLNPDEYKIELPINTTFEIDAITGLLYGIK